MPITLPPLSPPAPSDDFVRCEPMDLYGEPLLEKREAAAVEGHADSTLELILRQKDGEPVNTVLAFGLGEGTYVKAATGASIFARFREAIFGPGHDAPVEIVDAANGVIRVEVPAKVVDRPGVYLCNVAYTHNGRPKGVNVYDYWLWVNGNTWGPNGKQGLHSIPDLDSIRAGLSDDSLVKNLLTEHRAYPLPDICEAAVRTVRVWNESSPPIGLLNTTYFPYHNLLQDGIQLHLFQMAEEWYRRNRLAYSAGGTNVDDLNRMDEYHRAWTERYKIFMLDLQRIKVRINLSTAHGTLGSGHPWEGGWL